MTLLEALTRRGDLMKRMVEFRQRAADSARWQEGEEPPENAMELAAEWERVASELAELVARINHTNDKTVFTGEPATIHTLTMALATREYYGRERKFWSELADAAAGKGKRDWRFGRDEIKQVTTLVVTDLRHRADQAAKNFRDLDNKIQALNFTTELL